jgi:hypothetical protein
MRNCNGPELALVTSAKPGKWFVDGPIGSEVIRLDKRPDFVGVGNF